MYTFTAFCRKLIFPPKTGSPFHCSKNVRLCESVDLNLKLPVSLLKTLREGLEGEYAKKVLKKSQASCAFVMLLGRWDVEPVKQGAGP